MRTILVVALVGAMVGGCAPEPPPMVEPPRVTKPAKRRTPKKKKAPTEAGGSFEFGEGASGSVEKPKIDPKKSIAPSMEQMENALRWQDPAPGKTQKYVCKSCGVESKEDGRCCGRARIPVE